MNSRLIALIALFFVFGNSAFAQTWSWNTVPSSQLISNAQGVTAVCNGQAGDVWLGTDAGLVLYANQQFSVVPVLAGKFVRCLLYDSLNAVLWVGTDGSGLYTKVGTVWTQLFPQTQVSGIEARIQSLALHQGGLWVGGAEKGLFKWDGASWQQFNAITTGGQLPFSSVNALLTDAAGLWVATQTHGLYYLRNQGGFTYLSVDSGLPANHVQSLFKQGPFVWIGHSGTQSNNHLARYDTQQQTIQVFGPSTGYPAFRQVYAFAEDSAGRLWIGSHLSDFPLAYFDGQSFFGIPEFNAGFISSPVKSVWIDEEQSVWVGHFGGISVNTLLPTSIEEPGGSAMVLPYPNPFTAFLHLPIQTESTYWDLLNLQGEIVAQGYGKRISGQQLKTGFYLLRYQNESGNRVSVLTYRKND